MQKNIPLGVKIKEKPKKNQICDYCKEVSIAPLIFIRINKIDFYMCPQCHEFVCNNLINKGVPKNDRDHTGEGISE